jgi:hypothetical protein
MDYQSLEQSDRFGFRFTHFCPAGDARGQARPRIATVPAGTTPVTMPS